MTPDEAVREITTAADPDAAIRHVLEDTSLRINPRVLLEAAALGSRETRAWLHRHVFSLLQDAGNRIDAAYAVTTVSDDATRHRLAAEVREGLASGDEPRLGAFVRRVLAFLPPAGHEVITRHVGSGKTCRVSLLLRHHDDMLFAWKQPADDHPDTRAAMQWQVERSAAWVKLGVATGPVVWAPDGQTLLQPWVAGETLRGILRKVPFLTDASDPRRDALVDFLRTLAQARTFVSGLNGENLIYDGRRWRIVDSGHVRECTSPADAWDRQREDLRRKWTRWEGPDRSAAVEEFLQYAERALGFERPLSDLRRKLRRFLRRD